MKRAILFSVIVATAIAGYWRYCESVAATADKDARDFVLLNGYTNEGWETTPVSAVVSVFVRQTGSKPIGSRPLIGVGIPKDRLTDTMAKELPNIRNLNNITLFPNHPSGRGLDFEATVFTVVKSFRDLGLPLSSNSITMLEQRCPYVRIQIAQRSPVTIKAGSVLPGIAPK